MKKIIALALVAAVASVGFASSASALPPGYWEAKQAAIDAKFGKRSSPGETFLPNVKVADVREECALQGGEAKRQFDDAGNLIWICRL